MQLSSLLEINTEEAICRFWEIRAFHISDVFCKKGIVKNFAKLTGKQLCQSLFFNKIWHVFFPVNFAKFLGAPVFIKRLWWLFVLFEEIDLVSKVGGRYVVH